MKDTYYFQHDYNPTSDPKVQALIGEYGAIGYGIYWRIVEMLHEDELHKLQCKKFIYIALAKQMLTSVEQVESIIKNCIEIYELFKSDDDFFWSERVMRNISKRTEISNKRSKAGKISAESRKKTTSVEQKSTCVEQNPTKERKVKEIKVNNNNIYTHENVEQSSTGESEKKEKGKEINYQGLIDMFNKEFEGLLPKVVKLTDSRKKAIKNRIAENSKEDVIKVFNNVKSSDFLLGKEKDWACNFDWIFNSSNFVKILEGNYNKNNDVKSNCYD